MDMVVINVLNYNSFEKTCACIDSCLKQRGVDFSVLLIDNKSTDNSLLRLKKKYGDKINYLENNKNYGYAIGNNIGIRHNYDEGIKYTFLLNNDTVLVGDSLLLHLYTIATNNLRSAIVAPTILNKEKDGFLTIRNDSKYLQLLRKTKILPKNIRISNDIFTISEAQGSALFLNNEIFLKLGGLPEYYFMYEEESNYCKKVLWNKYNIYYYYSNESYVIHDHPSSELDAWRYKLMGRNRTLEYLENRNKFFPRWDIVFIIMCFYLFTKRYSKYYFQGIKDAKHNYRVYSHDDWLNDAIEIRNNTN